MPDGAAAPPIADPTGSLFGWMLPNGDGSRQRPAALATLPSALGWTRAEVRQLRPDLTLFETWAHARTPMTMTVRGQRPAPVLVLSMQLSGRTQVRHPEVATYVSTPEKWSFFRLPGADAESCFENQHGITTEVVTLSVTAERLRRMLDGQLAPAPIQELLDGRFTPSAGEARMTAVMQRILQQIHANPYQGAMAGLYVEGKIYEILAEALTGIAGQIEAGGQTGSRERRAALAARDRLLADLADPPSIEALARDCGLSQRRLNALFLDLFGATPFQCLTRWRLEQARSLLADGALSVKQIAHLTGYAHVSSFTHAFTRRFGAPPMRERGSFS